MALPKTGSEIGSSLKPAVQPISGLGFFNIYPPTDNRIGIGWVLYMESVFYTPQNYNCTFHEENPGKSIHKHNVWILIGRYFQGCIVMRFQENRR